MLKIIADDVTIYANDINELCDQIEQIFPIPDREDVLVTYLVSGQPVSYRMDPNYDPDAVLEEPSVE